MRKSGYLAVSNLVAALLLVAGLVIGAGGYYAVQNVSARAVTTTEVTTTTQFSTVTEISTSTMTVVTTSTAVSTPFGSFSSTVQISTSVSECDYNSLIAGAEACSITLTNSGNASTYATGSCTLTYDGQTNQGAVDAAHSGQAHPIPVGGSLSGLLCSYTTAAGAGAGVQVTGSIALADGGEAVFSATASS